MLVDTGRVPNVRGLGLEAAGVKLGVSGEVLVDDYLRTNVPSIWAVGDVINRIQLTPVALMEVRNKPDKVPICVRRVPSVTYPPG